MLEQEHKFEVESDFVLPNLAGVKGVTEVGEPIEQTLESTYFDTPDHRLAGAGVTVRRRTGGDDAGWHAKLPSAVEPGARHEIRVGLGRAVRTVPKRLRVTVSGLAGAQPLVPLATLTTRRTLRRLLDDEGVLLAEVADDEVEATAVVDPDDEEGGRPLSQWREIEVELVDVDADVVARVGRRLVKAGATPSPRRSKLDGVLGGPAAEPAPPTRPRDRVHTLVQDRLATQLDVLRRRDPLARENLPEGVHTMRVAVRRLQSALATFRPFLDRSVTDPLRDELKWLSHALGDARDAEVRRERLDAAIDALVAERPELDWDEERVRPVLWSSLVARHAAALNALTEVLTSDRYAALLDRLRELVAEPPWTDRATKRVRGAYLRRVQRELRRLRRRVAAADDSTLSPEERAHALHQARKAAKRARYAVEPLRPIYGSSAATLTKRLKMLQSALGQHQDTVVTRTYLLVLTRSTNSEIDPGAALVAGALLEREALASQRYEQRAAEAWQKVSGSPLPE